jgi:hypothetical protein|tara:strand:- start:274 stop:402 length:129 start_codon:yes stop_codon:yes gene_type:complete
MTIKEIEKEVIKLIKEDAKIPLISYEKKDLIKQIKEIFKQHK